MRVGEAVTEIAELGPLARPTVMCYTENVLSVFVQDGDLAYALPSMSGVDRVALLLRFLSVVRLFLCVALCNRL